MNFMKNAFLGLAFLGFLTFGASQARATTSISACSSTPISTVDNYVLTNDLTTTNTRCLEITGVADSYPTILDFDCAGYTITASQETLHIISNASSMKVHDCHFVTTNTASSTFLIDSTATTTHSGNLGTVEFTGCTFTGSGYASNTVLFQNANAEFISHSNTYSKINLTAYSGVLNSYNDTINLSAVSTIYVAAIIAVDANSLIQSDTILGKSTYVDDGIVFECNSATTACAFNVTYNTSISDVFDAAIEQVGNSAGYMSSNTFTNTPEGFGCYEVLGKKCNIDGMYFINNTHNSTNSTDQLMLLEGPGQSDTTSFFKNSTISGNTFTTTAGVSNATMEIGDSGPYDDWYTVSGNTISHNHFGSTSHLYWPPAGVGFTDGGSNYCYNSSPAVITCH